MSANNSTVWMITGAGRGLGAAIAAAALGAGDRVVATARNPQGIEEALGGPSERLLAVRLDVTRELQAAEAVAAACKRFGRIDVLVNNAGYGLLGALEECSAEEVERQFRTNVFGLLSVTRAVLPIMRAQRSGHVINLSSMAGYQGWAGASAYCASKFAVEGLSESLALELAPFGIHVTIVQPGHFRTEFLADNSITFAARTIADYDTTVGVQRQRISDHSGKQAGDPTKLGRAVRKIAHTENPPLRLPLGADAVDVVENETSAVLRDLWRWRPLSTSTDFDGQEGPFDSRP